VQLPKAVQPVLFPRALLERSNVSRRLSEPAEIRFFLYGDGSKSRRRPVEA